MENSPGSSAHQGHWISQILLLTWAAGTVDAIGYLGLGHVFTANMTGNAVLLGIAIGSGQGLAATRSLFALLGFVVGAGVGAFLAHRAGTEVDLRRAFLGPLVAEALVLGAFAVVFHIPIFPRTPATIYTLIGLTAVAMGIQSAAVRRLKLPGIATTVITVTITSLVAGVVRWLHLSFVANQGDDPEDSGTVRGRNMGLQAGVFLVYVAAAAASGFFQNRFPLAVGLSPIIVIVFVLVNALRPTKSSETAA